MHATGRVTSTPAMRERVTNARRSMPSAVASRRSVMGCSAEGGGGGAIAITISIKVKPVLRFLCVFMFFYPWSRLT